VETKLNTIQAITSQDNFAFLEDITEESYVYRFHLNISKSAVASLNANSLTVRTYYKDPKNEVQLSIFKQPSDQTLSLLNLNGSQLVSNIKRRNYDILNSITRTRQEYLTKQNFSLGELITFFNNGVKYTLIDPKNTKRSIRNFVFNGALTIPEDILREDRTVQQLSSELLRQYKIDAAYALKKPYSTRTSYETNNGTAPEFIFSNNQNKIEQLIISNLLSKNLNGELPSPIIQTYSVKERDVIEITVDVKIPISLIANTDFYVMFSIYDLSNQLVQEFVRFVPHKNNLFIFQRVQIPPVMTVNKSYGGNLTVFLQQLDPYASGIKIYKTVYNSTGTNSAAVQEFVGSYDLEYNQVKILEFENNSFGLLLFRAVAFSTTTTSTDFTSALIEVFPNDTSNISQEKQNSFIVLKHECVNGGLKLTINDFPADVAYVNLYKSDITEDLYANDSQLTTIMVRGSGASSIYTYFDASVEAYRKYRYTCELVDIKGQVYDSSANLEIYYRPVEQSYATLTIGSPVVTPIQFPGNSTQYYDVRYNITYAITNKLEDDVRALLVSQGLINYYGGDIDRNRLRQLLVTKIELRDLSTNDIYFMGFYDTEFVQSTTTFGLLSKSSNYTYILTTYIREPRTLLQNNVETGYSTPRGNGNTASPSYTYVPFNVDNPYGLLTGTNPKKNGSEFTSQYGIDQLALGSVGSIVEVPVNLTPPIPKINSIKAFMLNSKNVELVWSVNGSQDEISHFIIRRENIATSKVDLIGKAHGINVQNAYSFVDPVRYTETGIFRYIITMQYTDMSLSPDYFTNEVVI